MERKVSLSASSSQSGKLGEDTRQTFVATASAALASRAAALSRSVSPSGSPPIDQTGRRSRFPPGPSVRDLAVCSSSLVPLLAALKSAQVAAEKRPTVPTRASRTAFLSPLTSSLANCPVAVYSVSTASSPLFDISPPQSFVTSLTEINVGERNLSFFTDFFLVLHSLSHHSVLLSPPPVPLSVLRVSCFARSLLSEARPH